MRIIFLNSWFGKAGKPYFDFIKKESSKTDIFCFMEVSPDLHSHLSEILKDFNSVYDEGSFLEVFGVMCGQAVFVNKKNAIRTKGTLSIYRQLKDEIGFMQYLKLQISSRELWIGSVHGKTWPSDKKDTKARLSQSKKIIDFFKDKNGSRIIGGDFNLDLDTKSVKMFEKVGYKNLIKEFQIKSTRNSLTWEQFKDKPDFVKQYFADYVFVSPEVKVKSFEVPNVEVSDHLPQILEFEV